MRFVLTMLAGAALIASLPVAAQETASPAAAQAQAFAQLRALPEASRAALGDWLQRDCSVGVTRDENARLRAISGVNERVLIEAYNQGPPPETERESAGAFDRAYAARSATLARDSGFLSREDQAALQSVSREAYVARRMEQTRLNYRTNAVLGLGAVGGPGAVELLNRIAADAASPMRAAAQASLATLRAAPR